MQTLSWIRTSGSITGENIREHVYILSGMMNIVWYKNKMDMAWLPRENDAPKVRNRLLRCLGLLDIIFLVFQECSSISFG